MDFYSLRAAVFQRRMGSGTVSSILADRILVAIINMVKKWGSATRKLERSYLRPTSLSITAKDLLPTKYLLAEPSL